jgi:hypothetical protein
MDIFGLLTADSLDGAAIIHMIGRRKATTIVVATALARPRSGS